MSTRKPISIYVLVSLLTLQGLTALVCGAAMMWEPHGAMLKLPIALLDGTPFADFMIPGLFLFSCLGLLPLFAAYQLSSKTDTRIFRWLNMYPDYRFGWMLALFSGFATLIWIIAQLHFTRTFHSLQTVYASVGVLLLVTALLPATLDYCRCNHDAR